MVRTANGTALTNKSLYSY